MNEEFSMNVFEDRTICLKNFQIWNLFPIFFCLNGKLIGLPTVQMEIMLKSFSCVALLSAENST